MWKTQRITEGCAILQREEKEVPALGGWWLFGPASPLRMGAPPFGAVVVLVLRVGGLRPRGVPSALRASACAALPRLSRARAPFLQYSLNLITKLQRYGGGGCPLSSLAEHALRPTALRVSRPRAKYARSV